MKILFNEAERKALIEVAAMPELPGTIVHDFTALLEMIGEEGVPVSAALSEFTGAVVSKINTLLGDAEVADVQRVRQSLYPRVGALHLLLRATQIGRVDRSRATPRLVCHPALVERWHALNPTERYFELLEDWWYFKPDDTHWNPCLPDDRANWRAGLLRLLAKGGKARTREVAAHLEMYVRLVGKPDLALMQMFGMLEERPAKGRAKTEAACDLQPTTWGSVLCESYRKIAGYPESSADRFFLAEDGGDIPLFHYWAEQLAPMFPQWQNGLGEVPEEAAGPVAITLKVALDKTVWRRLVLPGERTFADLASLILKAFGFDDEHFYRFTYRDDFGVHREIEDYRYDEAEVDLSDALRLADVIRVPKMKITFDYDSWPFEITTENITAGKAGIKPAVVDKAGKAPRQYPLAW